MVKKCFLCDHQQDDCSLFQRRANWTTIPTNAHVCDTQKRNWQRKALVAQYKSNYVFTKYVLFRKEKDAVECGSIYSGDDVAIKAIKSISHLKNGKIFFKYGHALTSFKGHPYHSCVVVAERKKGKWIVWFYDPMQCRTEIPVLAMQLAKRFRQKSVCGYHGEQTPRQFDCFNRSFLFLTHAMFNDIRFSSKLTYVL